MSPGSTPTPPRTPPFHPSTKQERIIEYLQPDNYTSLRDLATYLGATTNRDTLREELGPLIRRGYVESRTGTVRGTREPLYRLTPLTGRGLQKRVQGRGVIHQVTSAWERWFGGFFILISVIFLLWQQVIISGNVVGNETPIDIAFFASLMLIILGGILLFKSLKK